MNAITCEAFEGVQSITLKLNHVDYYGRNFRQKFGFISRGMSSSGCGLSFIKFKQKIQSQQVYIEEWHHRRALSIYKSFSPQLITCRASGYLRHEFCELELLDEISKPRYEGELIDCSQSNFRNPLIRSYQKWKGINDVPPLTDPALKWSVADPLPLLLVVIDVLW